MCVCVREKECDEVKRIILNKFSVFDLGESLTAKMNQNELGRVFHIRKNTDQNNS